MKDDLGAALSAIHKFIFEQFMFSSQKKSIMLRWYGCSIMKLIVQVHFSFSYKEQIFKNSRFIIINSISVTLPGRAK